MCEPADDLNWLVSVWSVGKDGEGCLSHPENIYFTLVARFKLYNIKKRSYWSDINVTHAHTGGHNMAYSQHGVSRQTL